MMRTFKALAAAVAMGAVLLAGTGAAQAAPQTRHDDRGGGRLHSYSELVDALHRIERVSHGRIKLETIGRSHEGRDLYLAKVGTGPLRILYMAQQHGNEPLGAEAALALLARLSIRGSGYDDVLRKVTLLVIPRVNPDGAERFQRENHDPGCAGAWCTPGVGYDINRWHDPAVAPAANPVPEAAAVQRTFAKYRPAMVVDYHQQGSYVDAQGDLIDASIFWPNAAGVPAPAMTLSRQMCVHIYQTLEQPRLANVSQYPGTLPNGIARNAYGLQGAGSVLVEFRGGGEKKIQPRLLLSAYTAMTSTLQAAASGSILRLDPALADTIPLRGPSADPMEDDEAFPS